MDRELVRAVVGMLMAVSVACVAVLLGWFPGRGDAGPAVVEGREPSRPRLHRPAPAWRATELCPADQPRSAPSKVTAKPEPAPVENVEAVPGIDTPPQAFFYEAIKANETEILGCDAAAQAFQDAVNALDSRIRDGKTTKTDSSADFQRALRKRDAELARILGPDRAKALVEATATGGLGGLLPLPSEEERAEASLR